MTKSRKPKALKADYTSVSRIFQNLANVRKNLARSAERLDEPSHGLGYRDWLDSLVRLEAQADALGYVFQMQRSELEQWLVDMEAYYKKLEEAA